GPLRLGIAEATLPRAQRIGAHIEHSSSFGCLQRAHAVAHITSLTHSCLGAHTSCTGFAVKAVQLDLDVCTFLHVRSSEPPSRGRYSRCTWARAKSTRANSLLI